MENLLFIGDIVGKGGRTAIKKAIPKLIKKYNCSFCIVNGENLAHGLGINEKTAKDIYDNVNAITLGDHVWDQRKFADEISYLNKVIRPANLNPQCPGNGYKIFDILGKKIVIVNLLGSVFMKNVHCCPFYKIDELLNDINKISKCIFVDFHAEATGEKIAMGRFLAGKVTAVLGTHTHVQTSDAIIFDNYTAYISDVGMVGAVNSILGRNINDVIDRFKFNMSNKLNVVESGKFRIDAVVISYDILSGKSHKIQNISTFVDV